MLFLLCRRLPRFYPVLALIASNLVISMPAPPSKRSPLDASEARNGFSSVPKILEIQLPLKIASKDDLVAWAKYVMGLMASKINITLTTVKEAPVKNSGGARAPEFVRQFDGPRQQQQGNRNFGFKGFEVARPRQSNDPRQLEIDARYAENIRNLGHAVNFDRGKVSPVVRILENARHLESSKGSLRGGSLQYQAQTKDRQFSTPRVPAIAISGVTAKTLFNNHPLRSYGNLAVTDPTLPNPLEITASINVPRSRIKEQGFNANSELKNGQQQFFVPQFPDFGPVIDVKGNDIFKTTNAVPTPARAYLPVTATTDNIRFPSDPFVTRYFFDGVERNETNTFGSVASDVTFTTSSPLILTDEIPLPVRSLDLLSAQQRNSSSLKPLFNVPFEALITFTREGVTDATTPPRNDADQYFSVSTREPPFEQFPPYFDSNYTQTNESGQINVVFDDEVVSDAKNSTKTEERKKQEKKKEGSKKEGSKKEGSKKESSKKQKSKKQNTVTAALESPIGQFLKNFAALRRNSTPPVDLTPPPLKQEFATQRVPTRQRVPARQNGSPPDQGPQQYYPPRKPPPALRQGRRNQTSLAQELEDDDDDDSGSKEDNDSEENGDSAEKSGSDEGDDEKSDVESDEGGSSESSSSESESEESSEEEEGGFVNAIIELLKFAAPLLEDLSDPESDTVLSDAIEAGIPLFEELSENNDIPGLLGPLLLQSSGGPDGAGDSGAIFRPIIQLIAPLSGPLSGPLLIPLSRQSSQPAGQGGSSSIGDLLKASLEPLLQPAGPGKMAILSNVLAGAIASLSKNSSGGGKSDITALVKAIVTGSVAGTSAGSSGGSSGGKGDPYGAPTGYGTNYAYGPPASPPYAQPNKPQQPPNPLLVLGSSIKDILNAITKVVTSLVNAVTGVLGASSNSSNEPRPTYGPPRPAYGPPRPAYGPPRPTYGPPRQPYRAPPSDTISITTSEPERFARF